MTHIRVGITGLSRAGKTVFLTSTLYNLLATTGRHLPLFKANGVQYSGDEHALDGSGERFPCEENLKAYRAGCPGWSPPTSRMSEFSVDLVLVQKGKPWKSVRLTFVDYPGEQLHDLPLLNQSFGAWSRKTLDQLNDLPSPLNTARAEFEHALRDLPASVDTADIDDCPRRLTAAYGSLCTAARRCGVILPPVDASLSEKLPTFCPLAASVERSHPALWQCIATDYGRYVFQVVLPFRDRVGGCTHQLVLVDILDILRGQDEAQYGQAKHDLSAILQAFRYFNHGGRGRLAFVRRAVQQILGWLPAVQPRVAVQ